MIVVSWITFFLEGVVLWKWGPVLDLLIGFRPWREWLGELVL